MSGLSRKSPLPVFSISWNCVKISPVPIFHQFTICSICWLWKLTGANLGAKFNCMFWNFNIFSKIWYDIDIRCLPKDLKVVSSNPTQDQTQWCLRFETYINMWWEKELNCLFYFIEQIWKQKGSWITVMLCCSNSPSSQYWSVCCCWDYEYPDGLGGRNINKHFHAHTQFRS